MSAALPLSVAATRRVIVVARAADDAIEASCRTLQRLQRPAGAEDYLLFWLEHLAANRIGLTVDAEPADRWYARRRDQIEMRARQQIATLGLAATTLCVVCAPTELAACVEALGVDLLVLSRPAKGRVETGDDWWQLYVALNDAQMPVLIL